MPIAGRKVLGSGELKAKWRKCNQKEGLLSCVYDKSGKRANTWPMGLATWRSLIILTRPTEVGGVEIGH